MVTHGQTFSEGMPIAAFDALPEAEKERFYQLVTDRVEQRVLEEFVTETGITVAELAALPPAARAACIKAGLAHMRRTRGAAPPPAEDAPQRP